MGGYVKNGHVENLIFQESKNQNNIEHDIFLKISTSFPLSKVLHIECLFDTVNLYIIL